MKPYAEAFYKSRQWQACRDLVIARAGGLCQMCMKKGLIKAAAVEHHIKPITPQNINDPMITLNTDNLMALCTDCHAEIHSGKAQKRYKVDELGRVTSPR